MRLMLSVKNFFGSVMFGPFVFRSMCESKSHKTIGPDTSSPKRDERIPIGPSDV